MAELFLNLAHQLEEADKAPTTPDPVESSGPPLDGTSVSGPMQKRTFLSPDQDKQLAESYQDGVPIRQLARDFDIDRLTVRAHLEHMGVPRQPYRKVQGEDLQEVVRLYEAGASFRALSKQFDVSPDTIRARLIEAGVILRGPGRPPQN